jgi:UDP-2,3-diacylglucosamine pyrophosphatase LpxH
VPRNLAQTRLSFICESDHQLGEEVIEDIKAIIVRGQECWYMKGCGDN